MALSTSIPIATINDARDTLCKVPCIICKITKEPKTKKNCSEWLHEAIEKRNAEQHEQLEYPDLNLNYNKDGFYDDTPVVDTLHVDRFDYRLILKFLLIIVAMILIVLFFIWYAD